MQAGTVNENTYHVSISELISISKNMSLSIRHRVIWLDFPKESWDNMKTRRQCSFSHISRIHACTLYLSHICDLEWIPGMCEHLYCLCGVFCMWIASHFEMCARHNVHMDTALAFERHWSVGYRSTRNRIQEVLKVGKWSPGSHSIRECNHIASVMHQIVNAGWYCK